MTPVPLRLFHKVFFWASGSLLPPLAGKKWPLPAPMIALVSFDPLLNITDNSVVIHKLRQDKSGQALTCSGVFLWTLKRLISCLFVLWSITVFMLILRW